VQYRDLVCFLNAFGKLIIFLELIRYFWKALWCHDSKIRETILFQSIFPITKLYDDWKQERRSFKERRLCLLDYDATYDFVVLVKIPLPGEVRISTYAKRITIMGTMPRWITLNDTIEQTRFRSIGDKNWYVSSNEKKSGPGQCFE